MKAFWWLPVVLLVACGKGPEEPVDKVLAKVNGEAIYASDLEAAWQRTFSAQGALFAGEALEDRLLQSLVASRVMARKAEADMTDADKKTLDRQVAAWREEQLVKRYLEERVVPEPVSNEMVEQYYQSHPELFGGGERRHAEQLKVVYRGDQSLRDQAVDILGRAADERDWKKFSSQPHAQGLVVNHQHLRLDAAFEDKTLLARLKSLSEGQVSPLSMATGEVTVWRLTRVESLTPKPLSEVRDDIRRRLAPVKLRDAVKQAMEVALQDAKVVYSENDRP